jgi:hypothetical protein
METSLTPINIWQITLEMCVPQTYLQQGHFSPNRFEAPQLAIKIAATSDYFAFE